MIILTKMIMDYRVKKVLRAKKNSWLLLPNILANSSERVDNAAADADDDYDDGDDEDIYGHDRDFAMCLK